MIHVIYQKVCQHTKKSAFHNFYNRRNASLKMVENEQMLIIAMGYQILISYISQSTIDIELKFLVSWSIMIYNILTNFEQICRGLSWNIFEFQDV